MLSTISTTCNLVAIALTISLFTAAGSAEVIKDPRNLSRRTYQINIASDAPHGYNSDSHHALLNRRTPTPSPKRPSSLPSKLRIEFMDKNQSLKYKEHLSAKANYHHEEGSKDSRDKANDKIRTINDHLNANYGFSLKRQDGTRT